MADYQSNTLTLTLIIDEKKPLRCRLGLHINGWIRQEIPGLDHGFEYRGCVRCAEPMDEETAREIAHLKAELGDLKRTLHDG